MAEHENHRMTSIIKWIIVVLAIALVVLLIFLLLQSVKIRREQIISARELWIANLFKRRGPPTAADVGILRTWMTFSYINSLFKVPPNYFETQLSISDSRYPQLTIGGYAKGKNLNAATFLGNVETALREYLASSTVATSTGTGTVTTQVN